MGLTTLMGGLMVVDCELDLILNWMNHDYVGTFMRRLRFGGWPRRKEDAYFEPTFIEVSLVVPLSVRSNRSDRSVGMLVSI